jgi:hypothetical protein
MASKAIRQVDSLAASGSGMASSANQPTSAVSSGWAARSPPTARQWNTSEYSGMRVNPSRIPSITPISDRPRHSMPVSSSHLLLGDLGRRVADVGPPGGVEPHPRVGPLDEEDLALVVADDRTDGHLRGLVAGHPVPDRRHPLVHQGVGLEVAARGHPDVGGHLEDLLVALALVEVVGEAEPGAGDAGERLAPADEVLGVRARARSVDARRPWTEATGGPDLRSARR